MWLSIYTFAFAILILIVPASAEPDQRPHDTSDKDLIVPGHPQFPLRILPLGASITWGQASKDGNGYRDHLRELLERHSALVDMVGNVHSGDMPDNENEGHPGARVDQVMLYAEKDIPLQPNLVLINAGTNDVVRPSMLYPLSKIGDRMEKLIDLLLVQIPDVTVVLSTLIVNSHPGPDRLIRDIVNPQYRQLVDRMQARGERVILADLYPVLKLQDLFDGTHPKDEGYDKLADAWFQAIAEAGRKKLLVEPRSLGDPNINVPPDMAAEHTKFRAPSSLPSKPSISREVALNTITDGHGTISGIRTSTKALVVSQASCHPSNDQGSPRAMTARHCSLLGKAPTYVGQAVPTETPMSNAAQVNKASFFGWRT